LVRLGSLFVKAVQPQALIEPQPLPFARLVDLDLPDFDIHVYPASPAELRGNAALTLIEGDPDDPVEILILGRYYDALFKPYCSDYNFARATLSHEIGHALAHVPELRARPSSLKRRFKGEIPPFRDSEWQAWTLGGGIAMPLPALRMLAETITITPELVARTFKVSVSFAAAHLKRVQKAGLL
jgi:hypothetical protein